MRKIFLGLMLSSALAAVVIGGALAWTGSTSGSTSALAGNVDVALYNVAGSGNVVVPTGNPIKVADGGITNNGDIPVYVSSGSVLYTGNPICSTTGSVVVTNNNYIAVGQSYTPLYDVYLTMGVTADDACQNYTLPYTLTINVQS
ncbi:MAG: hypothetical protein AB7N24_16740 [Dehalococcoidia bacterium]